MVENRDMAFKPIDGVFLMEGLPTLYGVLADLANNFMVNAQRPHKICAYVGALSFGAVVCARNYSFAGSYSNTYNMIIGKTGCGKNDLEIVINNWAAELPCDDIIMTGSSFTSDSGTHCALVAQPQSLVYIDEFGTTLSNMATDNTAKTAIVTLTKAYTLNGTKMKPKKYTKTGKLDKDDDRKKVIVRPGLVLIGGGTPDQMDTILTPENFKNGVMSRYLFWYIPEVAIENDVLEEPLPERALNRIKDILTADGNTIANTDDGIKFVKIAPYDKPLPTPFKCFLEPGELDLHKLDFKQQEDVIACKDVVESALLTRNLDKAKRLAITLALLNQPYRSMQSRADIKRNGVIIPQKALADGLELASRSCKVMKKYEAEREVYPGRIVKAGNKIDALVHICGKGWTTRAEIALNGIKVSPNDWKMVEEYLEDIGIGWHEPVLPGQRGRSVRIYGQETPDHLEAVKYDLDGA